MAECAAWLKFGLKIWLTDARKALLMNGKRMRVIGVLIEWARQLPFKPAVKGISIQIEFFQGMFSKAAQGMVYLDIGKLYKKRAINMGSQMSIIMTAAVLQNSINRITYFI